jgi:hypothetical protein
MTTNTEQIATDQAAVTKKVAEIWAARQPSPEKVAASYAAAETRAEMEIARQAALTKLAMWRKAKLRAGFDTGLGFAIGIGGADQHAFAANKVMLDSAVQSGQRTLDSQIVVADVKGDPYSVTVAHFYQVMLAYGAYCEAFFQQYTVADSHLRRATTLAEVQSVQLPR